MFGISFWKILLLVAVVAAVWFGFRWFQRWEQERRAAGERTPGRLGGSSAPAEELQLCRVCGAYVAAGAPRCGRRDCPLS
jgi:uncharacterized protein